ncbi:hypothetical protein ACWEF6_01855 [Amycolatopsis sp. NPDC004772]
MLAVSERRNALFQERERAHRRWEIARAIGATRETRDVLKVLANSRDKAFRRAYKAERVVLDKLLARGGS